MTWAADAVPKAVQDNSIYIYVVLLLVVLGAIVSWLANKLPIIGKTVDAWNTRRRRSAKAAKAADVSDMKEQLGHFEQRVAHLEGEANRWRTTLAAHREWDYEAVEAYLALRIGQQPLKDLPMPPPPLYPPPIGQAP